jgi:L-methionine (R)-S-oxide reductase
MFNAAAIDSSDKTGFYRELAAQVASMIEGETDHIANAANVSALLFDQMPDLNWAGFYFLKSPDELVVGPFQGKPACVRIRVGKGVCGTAVEKRASILVEDVDAFPGHIACDSASRSELVVPLIKGEKVLGVIDLDSPSIGRFDTGDQAGIEAIAALYVGACNPA